MSDSRCDKAQSEESPLGCAQLRQAVDAAGIGLWRRDGHARQVTLDARSCELHGLEYTGDTQRSWSELLERVHPEDHPLLLAAWDQASEGGFRDLEYRCVSPDGEIRWVSCSGSYMQDVASKEPSVFGLCMDVTHNTMLVSSDVVDQVAAFLNRGEFLKDL